MSGPGGGYYDTMREADDMLAEAISHISAEHDAGRITTLQAALERVGLLERHIALCQQLRREYHLDGVVVSGDGGG